MSFFPAGFDPRAPAARVLRLANLSTPDGDFGFIVGTEGRFTDVTGKAWVGSTLITAGDTEMSLNGTAPSGSVTLSFLQDPDAPDLVAQVRALGPDYVAGRAITFWIQPFTTLEEMYVPVFAPCLYATRVMRKISLTASGAQDRAISLSFEGPFEFRKGARRRIYNTTDHGQLLGAANPSLTYIPTDNRRDEKIWG
ncbi:hypothetical protein KM176_24460 [Pseudooceanicola sp. CBS1P-1]|uniref:Uncharacterized protein n=1 Tax=Pseudooceanicola albus TaxID=2692189 RepID=A0A6L7GEG6_9RHOB|nr:MULTISPECIES: hypothetical protein [Pseudooceanicola]MBT9387016.1 hypothetical protein [Pseudooceanicola endophyticus]MXN21143.1 hypothetical protein [Pseudooceanicola albus]